MGKLFILGIDGATWDIIRPMVAEGRLANLRCLLESGTSGELESTIPPLSAPAWISFMTGKNPGKHGVLDFFYYDLKEYGPRPGKLADSTRFAGTTIWDIMSAHAKKVGAVTVPVTFPAWPINGVMVSGHLMTPETATGYTYPPELEKRIGESPNVTELYKKSTPPAEVMWRGPAMMERRTKIALELMAEDEFDCFMLVLAATDKAQHTFWRFLAEDDDLSTVEERAKYGDAIARHYEKADWTLGQLLGRMSADDTVIVMSDHGAGLYPPRSFHTNLWLANLGLLRVVAGKQARSQAVQRTVTFLRRVLSARFYTILKSWLRESAPDSVSGALEDAYENIAVVDWGQTKAYRFSLFPFVEGIVINLKGRQPGGIVDPGEDYDRVRRVILEEVQKVTDPLDGTRLVEAAYLREELYTGDRVEDMPDIVVLLNPRYRGDKALSGEVVTPTPLYDRRRFGGTHRMGGIFLAKGPAIRRGHTVKGSRLIDLPPTILYLMGLAIPEDMDGEPLMGMLESDFVDRNRVRYTQWRSEVRVAGSHYSEEEEDQVRERLEGLGYL